MRPSSSTSEREGLLSPLFGATEVDAELSDRALLAAMLDVEAALARACAAAGAVPVSAAEAITAACDAGDFDIAALGRAAVDAGNPVVPLVRALGERIGGEAESWVHHGATSQDVLDTALMLVARRATAPLLRDLGAAADRCAELAETHRLTVQVGRTLGQQAAPTTFGLTAAGWLGGLSTAARRLADVRADLPVQLGGPVGTLAVLGEHALAVPAGLAAELGLREPPLSWHTDRSPVLDVSAALAGVLSCTGKVALDVGLLAQTEVDELREGSAPGRGGSSAMPHKRNPVTSVLVVAAARRAPGLLGTLVGAGLHEHQRAGGSWHAEWEPLLQLLRLAGGAAHRTARLLEELEVRPDRMRANLDATGGVVLAESVAARLAPYVGRSRAHDLVGDAVRAGGSFHDALLATPEVARHLGEAGLRDALDPAGWVGAAPQLVDRAVAAHRTERTCP
jgi:3-carboxy-cis,cis-muconate cycloisomerase